MNLHRSIFTILIIVLIALCTGFSVSLAERPVRPDLIFAYMSNIFLEIDSKDATAATKVWVRELASSLGHNSDSYIADNVQGVIEDLQKGNVDVVGLSTIDYLRIRNKLNAEPIMSSTRGGKNAQTYYLITKKGSGFIKIGDLKNRKIAVLKNDQTSLLFLNTLLLRNNLPEAASFFSEVQEKTRPSQMILAVFFGQLDACVATEYSLATIAELNPQMNKSMHIVASSPALVDKVMVIRKDYRDEFRKRIIASCLDLKNSPRGKQLLNLFKIEELVLINESSLDTLRGLLAEYDRLKANQGKHVARGG